MEGHAPRSSPSIPLGALRFSKGFVVAEKPDATCLRATHRQAERVPPVGIVEPTGTEQIHREMESFVGWVERMRNPSSQGQKRVEVEKRL